MKEEDIMIVVLLFAPPVKASFLHQALPNMTLSM